MSNAVYDDDEFGIEIRPGDVPNGTYNATLTKIKDLVIDVKDETTGQLEERQLIEWTFSLDDGSGDVKGVTSRATGPKSKAGPWLRALLGSDPEAGRILRRDDLLGREVMVVVVRDKNEYAKVETVTARPR